MVSDYLLSEIFEKQSEETQHILLKLSLLPRFNRSLIDDLFSPLQLKKSASGEALINRFLRSNLFVVPLDKANQWVRFHRQFKQILLERLNATFSPEKIEELLQMYREWFNSKGYTEEAKSIQKTASETEMPKGSTVEPSVKTSRSPEKKLVEPLSIREQEILELVAQGMRNKEIAEKLFVSSETVKKHLYHMFQKLGVKSRVQMINKAKEMDLITP